MITFTFDIIDLSISFLDFELHCFIEVKEHMISVGLEPLSAEMTFIADQEVKLEKEQGESLFKLVDLLEDVDDVQKVYTNASIAEEF